MTSSILTIWTGPARLSPPCHRSRKWLLSKIATAAKTVPIAGWNGGAAPAGRLIYAAARDITERKQAEEALEDRLRFERLLSDLSARFVNMPS